MTTAPDQHPNPDPVRVERYRNALATVDRPHAYTVGVLSSIVTDLRKLLDQDEPLAGAALYDLDHADALLAALDQVAGR